MCQTFYVSSSELFSTFSSMTNKPHQLQQKLFYCFGDRDILTIYVGYAGSQGA